MTTKSIAILLSTALIIAVAACKKSANELPQPAPGPVDNNSYVQFSANAVQLTNRQLYALVSIETKTGQEVFSNKKLTLDYIQGVYETDKLPLPKGEYKLSKFIVVTALDTAVYAAPMANSAKASQVTGPLAIAVNVANFGINSAAVQVLKLNDSDVPQSFGYNEADFGFLPFITVSVKLKINIGQVAYDSLPGKLFVTATNGQGNQWIREIDLKKGMTSVRIPENYAEFKFEAKQWNLSAVKNFTRSALQPSMLIELQASRQPKKLLEESVFIENNQGLAADSRSEYFYSSNNLLQEIKNYQRSTQASGLHLTNIYKFIYSGITLDTVHRYAPDNSSTGYTAFFYNAGRVSAMDNKSYDQQSGAALDYDQSGGNDLVNVDYLYDNGSGLKYRMKLFNGNKIYDDSRSSMGHSETGNYEYDDYINPKYHLGYPDMYFSNTSKNNVVNTVKEFAGAYPSVVPYKYEYSYDADGYPTQVYISYKGYFSQQHVYRIKKTYRYL